jgi:hypothetical protein
MGWWRRRRSLGKESSRALVELLGRHGAGIDQISVGVFGLRRVSLTVMIGKYIGVV